MLSCARFLILIVGVFLAIGCRQPTSPAPLATTAQNWFEDVTTAVGVDFVHDAGLTGRYLIPEQMGSGCALFDADNDGRLDIYLIQNGGPKSSSKNRLYLQKDNGTFKDVSSGSGLDVAGFGMGVAIGDINNDALPDVLLTEYGAARLFQNQGSVKFAEITASAGIDNPRWATSASFFDYDRDGWLDIVIGNYLDYDPTQKCINSQGKEDFCGPHGFPGVVTKLYRNLGGGTGKIPAVPGTVRFADTTVSAGLARVPGPALGVLCADFNGDRWPDIFLADDAKPNRLFINKHDGTFAEEAALHGLAYNAMGQTAGNMGMAVADVNADGLFDVFVTHLTEELHALWVQESPGIFQDRTAALNLAQPLWRGTGFGTALADFDADGDADLVFVNGAVRRYQLEGKAASLSASPIRRLDPFWAPYAQRNQLFVNEGGRFREISLQNPALCGQAVVGRGLAWGDIDNNGSVDLLITSTGGPAQVLRNIAAEAGDWLIVRAVDPALGGRDVYGAEITLTTAKKKFWRLIQPGSSYLSSSDARAHFGLGASSMIQSIHVTWPDGADEQFPSCPPNQILILRKGAGKRMPS
jgi:hypothetical protein